MSDESNREADRIAAYLTGEGTPAERAELEVWLGQDPANRSLAEQVKAQWNRIEPADAAVDVSAMMARVAAEIGVSSLTSSQSDGRSSIARPSRFASASMSRGRRWWTGAVVGALVAASTVMVIIAVSRHGGSDTDVSSPSRVYATTTGQQATITLPDGSQVRLAPESRLRFGARFGMETRTVSVSGEAFFNVTNAMTPFVVHTGVTLVRVLGTSFNVRRYAGDRAAQIAVVTGKVAVGNAVHTVTVPAGQIALASDSSNITVVAGDPSISSAWVDGRLIFDDTPVRTMLATVGRWYDYDFRLADSAIALRHVGAVFRLGETAKTLSAIADLLDVRVTVHGRVVTLTPRQRSPASAPGFRSRRDSFPISPEVGK